MHRMGLLIPGRLNRQEPDQSRDLVALSVYFGVMVSFYGGSIACFPLE